MKWYVEYVTTTFDYRYAYIEADNGYEAIQYIKRHIDCTAFRFNVFKDDGLDTDIEWIKAIEEA